MNAPPRRLAAVGCRAHTGWAALVVIAGDAAHLDVVARHRIELADPAGGVPRAVYQRSRGLQLAEAAARLRFTELTIVPDPTRAEFYDRCYRQVFLRIAPALEDIHQAIGAM